MKYLLSTTVFSLLLSGCSMYSPDSARVVNRNIPYDKPVAVISGNPESLTKPISQIPVAVMPTNTVSVMPPAAVKPAAVQVSRQLNQYQTTVTQTTNSDSWNVKPQQTGTVNIIPDEPKLNAVNKTTDVVKEAVQEASSAISNAEKTVSNTVQNELKTEKAGLTNPLRPKVADNNTSVPVAASTAKQAATTTAAAEENKTVAVRPPVVGGDNSGETAVSSLLKKASASLGKGDLEGAAAYLENAQRIEPKNSKILYDIANIRYHQGRYKDAESLAGKAVRTGTSSNNMMKKSWTLISNARSKLGDSQGAMQAGEMAAQF